MKEIKHYWIKTTSLICKNELYFPHFLVTFDDDCSEVIRVDFLSHDSVQILGHFGLEASSGKIDKPFYFRDDWKSRLFSHNKPAVGEPEIFEGKEGYFMLFPYLCEETVVSEEYYKQHIEADEKREREREGLRKAQQLLCIAKEKDVLAKELVECERIRDETIESLKKAKALPSPREEDLKAKYKEIYQLYEQQKAIILTFEADKISYEQTLTTWSEEKQTQITKYRDLTTKFQQLKKDQEQIVSLIVRTETEIEGEQKLTKEDEALFRRFQGLKEGWEIRNRKKREREQKERERKAEIQRLQNSISELERIREEEKNKIPEWAEWLDSKPAMFAYGAILGGILYYVGKKVDKKLKKSSKKKK